MTIITDQAQITHPAWCDPAACRVDERGDTAHDVYHFSADTTVAGSPPEGTPRHFHIALSLQRIDNLDGQDRDEPTVVMWDDQPTTVDQLEAVGSRLLELAAQYRHMIETEDGR